MVYHKDDTSNSSKSSLPRPEGKDCGEWTAYWTQKRQSWRTEPEISPERQKVLAECRIRSTSSSNSTHSFKGQKLDRADIEWLLATHENGLGPVMWNDEQQRNRKGLDLRGAELRGDGDEPLDVSKLPLAGLICTSVKLEGIILNGARLEGSDFNEANLSEAKLENANLSEAQLENTQFYKAELRETKFNKTHLKGTNFSDAQLEKADFSDAQLEDTKFYKAKLKGADFSDARLEGAKFSKKAQLEDTKFYRAKLKGTDFSDAHLEGANFSNAQLEGVNFSRTHLENAQLSETQIKDADFSGAYLEGSKLNGVQIESVQLGGVTLSKENGVGPFLVDIQWGNTNLAVVDWSQVTRLGETQVTRQNYNFVEGKKEKKNSKTRLDEHQTATRANRQLAVALQGQGMYEEAIRFAYRANVLQRKVFWYQIFEELQRIVGESVKKHWLAAFRHVILVCGKCLQYLFSHFLNLLAGYGYYPIITLGWYIFVVGGFSILYAIKGPLIWWPDALVYSVTSFHGRGFLPNLDNQPVTLHTPVVAYAALEAIIGLLIELSFIATFTQRFFGK